MIVVVDTNVLVQLFGKASSHRPLRDALRDGVLVLAVSTPILLEYEEVICRYADHRRWQDVERFLELVSALHGTVRLVSPSFRFRPITGDPDDDAFADCAIVANADWIITSDHHFDVMTGAGYKPQPVTPEKFIAQFLG